MVIEVVVPTTRRARAARSTAVCDELGVDHTLRTIEAETY